MNYLILYTALILKMIGTGGSGRAILTDMNKSYLKLNSYSVQFSYKLYQNSTAPDPLETVIGHLDRASSSYYFKMEDMEYLRNEKYMLAIDHGKRLMILNKSFVQVPTPLSFVDSVMANYFWDVEEIPGDKDTYHLTMTPPGTQGEEYDRIDMFISKNERDIKRIVLYLVEQPDGESQSDINDRTIDLKKPRIEIEYQHLTKNPSFGPAHFSESKFLIVNKGGKLAQTSRYMSYKLFNQF